MPSEKQQKTKPAKIYAKVYVCTNFRTGVHSSCAARGSKQLFKQLHDLAKERAEEIIVEQIVCLGKCEKGPNMRIAGGEIINGVGPDDLPKILDRVTSASADQGGE